MIAPQVFAKAQRRLKEVEYGRVLSDRKLLDRLADLLRKKGHLSLKLMMTTKGIPHYKTYAKRFGSLADAFRRVGFEPKARYCFKETAARTEHLIASVARDIIVELESRQRSITFLPELRLLTIGSIATVSLAVARVTSDGRSYPSPKPRWEMRRLKYRRSDLVLIVRLDSASAGVKDYFLLPTACLPTTRDGRIRISNRALGEFRCEAFALLISMLLQRLECPARHASDEVFTNPQPPASHSAACFKSQARPKEAAGTRPVQNKERPRAALMERR